MTPELQASYRCCAERVRRSASNLCWAFWMLPTGERQAMNALYAFSRHSDDLGDSNAPLTSRREQLHAWRKQVVEALENRCPPGGAHALLGAIADTAMRYEIPATELLAVIDGVSMDLQGTSYCSFNDLSAYCDRVAGSVGRCCVRIWGYQSNEVWAPVTACGRAFQLTNILRDLREDSERGRVYLPAEDLLQFAYPVDDLVQGVCDERFRNLMQFEVDRARQLYTEGERVSDYLPKPGRRLFQLMLATYRGLLDEIQRRKGDVFHQRVRVGAGRKLGIVLRQMLRPLAFSSPARP